ncbi:MAG: glycosyltransferase [Alphaproteobacteria bacterium]|nr:MAG: glycosyltransferase [Alphaproteobacteria bacterium]
MTSAAKWLVIFVKAPQMGRVKSRLAKEVGPVAATRFYHTELTRLLRELGRDPRWQTIVAVTPDRMAYTGGHLFGGLPVIGQGPGDLGARMQRCFETLPPGPVVLVGADIPSLKAAHIAAAFEALGSHDAVFGPAEDGGYWLVGQKRVPRTLSLFNGVRWSSPHALSDTLANLPKGRLATQAHTLWDVDIEADYKRWIDAGR